MALPAHSGLWPLIQFRNHFSQTVGLLRRVISSSLGSYLNTGKQTQNKRTHTNHLCLNYSNPTHDPSVQANVDSSCLRPRGTVTGVYIYILWRIYAMQELQHRNTLPRLRNSRRSGVFSVTSRAVTSRGSPRLVCCKATAINTRMTQEGKGHVTASAVTSRVSTVTQQLKRFPRVRSRVYRRD
jgi:hypothetical protein